MIWFALAAFAAFVAAALIAMSTRREAQRLMRSLSAERAARQHQAEHDDLTGLLNRAGFQRRLAHALDRTPQGHGAVMLIDLDRFKDVNDTLGHQRGDSLLIEIATRLAGVTSDRHVLARLGGDEFGVLMPGAGSTTAVRLAHTLCSELDRPLPADDLSLFVGGSIGIALYPDHGGDPGLLLQRADVAMYTAKSARSGIQVYVPDADGHSARRLELVSALRSAVEQRQISVYYQPKADLRTGRVVGVEALIRWFHPKFGFVAPEEFIPLAEQTGLINTLTQHVIRTGLAQCRRWRQDGEPLSVAVNLSVTSLHDLALPGMIARLLAEAGLDASALVLEVTESGIMADPGRAIGVLTALADMGVGLAIDDFGTGYSSLSYLKRLPVDELKIDKSFVLNMAGNGDDAVIVRSTIDLGHNLTLRVVAEGVEDHRTCRQLVDLGCDVVQGYYLSRPISAPSIDRWLADWDPSAAPRLRGTGRAHLRSATAVS